MSKELTEYSDEELLEEGKKIKSSNIMDAMMIGVLIGISLYSAFRNGVGLGQLIIFEYEKDIILHFVCYATFLQKG